MTTRARQVLVDCEHALADFAASANSEFQRPRWIAVITLLRTVLDVLEQVDARDADRTKRSRIHAARKRLFEKKPEPRIFHDFIEDERNDAVHEYELGAAVNVRILVGQAIPWMPTAIDPRGGTGTTTYEFFMRDGPFKGRDPRELCREAIEFWRAYLNEIDSPDTLPQHRSGR